MTTNEIHLSTIIPESLNRNRLDRVLAQSFPDYSRSQWQKWVKNGSVSVNGQIETNVRRAIATDDHIDVRTTLEVQISNQPQEIPLAIIYEDDDLLVINKPAGLTVHPGAGQADNTLLNALLHHDASLNQLPRAGLIHRLDKKTSGLLVIAKTLPAYTALITAMKERQIQRQYMALVKGVITLPGTIEAPIGRHPRWRTHMTVSPTGKPAVTHYTVEHTFPSHTLLKLTLESGRTHQIRVHLTHIKHPVIGDPIYGLTQHVSLKNYPEAIATAIAQFPRQALHAYRLSLQHPMTEETLTWQSPLPDDMQQLLHQMSGTADE